MTTRLAVITDIHHGRDGFSKCASQALSLFEGFVDFVNDAKPDLVLDLGDRISDESEETDLCLEQQVADAFKAISCPVMHICGNHDRDFLTVAQNEEILGQSLANQAIDIGDWTILIWRADAKNYPGIGFALPESDLLWLSHQVVRATKPLAIFTHAPLSDHDTRANYWFNQNPDFGTYPNSQRIRTVLEMARVPIVSFSGHVHWNTLNQINGIPYSTLQSLTESFTTQPDAANAWSLIELDSHISCETFGLDAMQWRLPANQTMRRWLPTLPPFPENPEVQSRRASTA